MQIRPCGLFLLKMAQIRGPAPHQTWITILRAFPLPASGTQPHRIASPRASALRLEWRARHPSSRTQCRCPVPAVFRLLLPEQVPRAMERVRVRRDPICRRCRPVEAVPHLCAIPAYLVPVCPVRARQVLRFPVLVREVPACRVPAQVDSPLVVRWAVLPRRPGNRPQPLLGPGTESRRRR